ncbi:hypothetical protein EYC84_010988 [Monilinia fructicola]|uniref:Uncharacterized protein n=1 Tax=Monilinia fructicola TaxID=38448 RepID=A0A5M9JBM2_MONFR|nr:hypothetical protein EYC84_010988 [Monilinia fructicola]
MIEDGCDMIEMIVVGWLREVVIVRSLILQNDIQSVNDTRDVSKNGQENYELSLLLMRKSAPHPLSRNTPTGGRMMARMILQISLLECAARRRRTSEYENNSSYLAVKGMMFEWIDKWKVLCCVVKQVGMYVCKLKVASQLMGKWTFMYESVRDYERMRMRLRL